MADAFLVGGKLKTIHRLWPETRVQVEDLVQALNATEINYGQELPAGYITAYYKLERTGGHAGDYCAAAYWQDGHREAGMIVRCDSCGDVFDIWDGQIEECLCGAE